MQNCFDRFASLFAQVETTPTQFADPNVYLWNVSNNGELLKLEGFNAPPLHRTPHCADYATIRQQVGHFTHLPPVLALFWVTACKGLREVS